MKNYLLYLCFALFLMPNLLFGQSSSLKCTQVLIKNDINQQTKDLISDNFYLYKDVETSRMEPTTHVYMCIYKETEVFDEDVIVRWFENQNIEILCYYTEIFVSGVMFNIKDANCE